MWKLKPWQIVSVLTHHNCLFFFNSTLQWRLRLTVFNIRSIKKGAMQSTDRVKTQMQTVLKLAAWLHCWLGLSRVTPSARASSSPSGICHYSALCIVQCAYCPVWLQFSFQTKSKLLNIFSKTVHLGCSPGPPRPFHPLLTKAASSE